MDDGRCMSDGAPPSGPGSETGGRRSLAWATSWDLLACCLLVAAACAAFAGLAEGSPLRMAAALPVLFFAPGYLLIEAVAGPVKEKAQHAVRAIVAIGVSPGIVGLLALAAAVLPAGFHAAPIVLLLAVACGVMAAAGLWRRVAHVRRILGTPAAA